MVKPTRSALARPDRLAAVSENLNPPAAATRSVEDPSLQAARDIAEVPAVEVITAAAVNLLSAA